jgi:hypothetical protein
VSDLSSLFRDLALLGLLPPPSLSLLLSVLLAAWTGLELTVFAVYPSLAAAAVATTCFAPSASSSSSSSSLFHALSIGKQADGGWTGQHANRKAGRRLGGGGSGQSGKKVCSLLYEEAAKTERTNKPISFSFRSWLSLQPASSSTSNML